MLMKPPRCWRNRDDCAPLHSIESLPEMKSESDWDDLEQGRLQPNSFVCGGCVKESERAVPQDAYRLCWWNDEVDEMGEFDDQDIAHHVAVLTQMQAIIAARRTASGSIDVLDDSGGLKTVQVLGDIAPSVALKEPERHG